MAKKIIWCLVTCGRCGGLAYASGYYSPERIKKNLTLKPKNWLKTMITEFYVRNVEKNKELGR